MDISNRPSVAVLMSAYNGEKYLREQVDSILNQKDVDVRLFVRDDGSTDTTVDIIRGYMDANPGKISLTTGENLGPGRSFMELLYNAPDTYDYYAFSDQDDVWLADKLIAGITVLKARGKELYVGNMMCIDENEKETGLRHYAPPRLSPYIAMGMNPTHGCTMVFTNKFYALLVEERHRPDEILFTARYHDSWAMMVGNVLDVVTYDFGYHMLYRQHQNNETTTVMEDDGIRERVRKSTKNLSRKIRQRSRRNGRSKIAHEIVRAFPEESARFPYLAVYAEPRKLRNKIKLIQSYADYKKNGGAQSFLGFCLYVCLNLI